MSLDDIYTTIFLSDIYLDGEDYAIASEMSTRIIICFYYSRLPFPKHNRRELPSWNMKYPYVKIALFYTRGIHVLISLISSYKYIFLYINIWVFSFILECNLQHFILNPLSIDSNTTNIFQYKISDTTSAAKRNREGSCGGLCSYHAKSISPSNSFPFSNVAISVHGKV